MLWELEYMCVCTCVCVCWWCREGQTLFLPSLLSPPLLCQTVASHRLNITFPSFLPFPSSPSLFLPSPPLPFPTLHLPLEVGPYYCGGVRGGYPATKAILEYLEPMKSIWWQGFRFFLFFFFWMLFLLHWSTTADAVMFMTIRVFHTECLPTVKTSFSIAARKSTVLTGF